MDAVEFKLLLVAFSCYLFIFVCYVWEIEELRWAGQGPASRAGSGGEAEGGNYHWWLDCCPFLLRICQQSSNPRQVSWWPFIVCLILLALLLPDIEGDGWRICIWILKFVEECLYSVSCLNLTQTGSRPASSRWFKGLAIYHAIQWASAFLSGGDEQRGGGGVRVLKEELKTGKKATTRYEVLGKKHAVYVVVNVNCILHAW